MTDFQNHGLYGEKALWPEPDLVHCETISFRSRKYDWEIKPHRHRDILQILYIRKGQARCRLDEHLLSLRGECILVVPAGTIHGFSFDPQVRGHVISSSTSLVAPLAAREPALAPALLQCGALLRGRTAHPTALLLRELTAEYAARRCGRDAALTGLLQAMLVQAGRCPLEAAHGAPEGRNSRRLHRFQELLERDMARQHRVAYYAHCLGITPTYLNRICRAENGLSALQIIHDRLLREARRQLVYSNRSIQAVASELGFEDAAYFSRFFQRLSGLTPSAFREAFAAGNIRPR